MKKIYLIAFLPFAAQAQTTITPQYYDLTPGDGVGDAGTYTNPYVVKSEDGDTQAVIRPRYHDLTPNDGLIDAGSYTNPYEINDSDY